MSLPGFRSFIVFLGILVALLIGIFTLHAEASPFRIPVVGPVTNELDKVDVDVEAAEVTSAPIVLVYDKNFDLILSTNINAISSYERQHLDRLLNICELLMNNDETAIYWLDK